MMPNPIPNPFKTTIKGHRALLASTLAALCLATPAFGDVIYQQDFEGWNNASGLWSGSTKASLGGPYTTVLGRFATESVTLDLLATPENTAGLGGSGDGSTPFNITARRVANNRVRIPFPDSGGAGGGARGPIGPTINTGPIINLGQAIRNANSGNDGVPKFTAGTYALNFDAMIFDSWDGDNPTWGIDSLDVSINGVTRFNEVFFAETPKWDRWTPDEYPVLNAFNPDYRDYIFRDVRILFDITDPADAFKFEFIGSTSQGINDESWGIDNIMIERVSPARSESLPGVPTPGTLALLGTGLMFGSRRRR